MGYWARGVAYLAVGWLATLAAVNDTQPPTLKGAFTAIAEQQPVGWLLLAMLAGGLVLHGVWRLIQAVLDLHGEGGDFKGLAKRAGALVSAVLHAGLGLMAVAVVVDWEYLIGGRDGSTVETWITRILEWPLGRWLVAVVGVGAILMGLVKTTKARSAAFQDIQAGARLMSLIKLIGRLGLISKGLIFALIGFFFLTAAWQTEPTEAGGVRAAFHRLGDAPLGDWLFAVVAAGLMTYGLFSLLKGWYHRLPDP